MISPSPRRPVQFVGKLYGDPDYDYLLEQFARDHPLELEVWKNTERELFEARVGIGAYPDQWIMRLCVEYFAARVTDECGGMGPHHVWSVLRGRILHRLFEDVPGLNPAPGATLMTDPRSCKDEDLRRVAEGFRREQPRLWAEWERAERAVPFDSEALRVVSIRFDEFVRAHCWTQSFHALTIAFLAVRGLCFWPVRQRSG